MNVQRLLSTKDAARRIGLAPQTLTTDRCTGRLGIPYLKLGRKVAYRAADLDDWLDSRVVRPGK